MKPSLFLAAALLIVSVLVAASPLTTKADGCASTKTDSNGRTCSLQSETVTTCTYYNDSTHCSGGSGDDLLFQ